MKSVITSILIISICLLSCSKEKLENEEAIFIGKWNWLRLEYKYGWCLGPGWEFLETFTPETENVDFTIKISKKGKITFYKDNESIEKGMIRFQTFELYTTNPDTYYYHIDIDDESNKQFWGLVSEDTMRVSVGFVEIPFDYTYNSNCESYFNYFVRE